MLAVSHAASGGARRQTGPVETSADWHGRNKDNLAFATGGMHRLALCSMSS